jgi:DNA-binding response OmpR family regulator
VQQQLEELVARVRAVLRRHALGSPVPLRVADLRLDAQGRQAWRGDRALELPLDRLPEEVLPQLARSYLVAFETPLAPP